VSPARARGREEVGRVALRVPRSELAEEMGGANLQGGGGSAGDGARDAWLARHAGGGDGDQRARGGGSTGPELVTTTLRSCAKAGAGASARQEKVLTVLAGGKKDQESAA